MFLKVGVRSMNFLELLFGLFPQPRITISKSVGMPNFCKVAVGALHTCGVGTVFKSEYMISILTLFAVTLSCLCD